MTRPYEEVDADLSKAVEAYNRADLYFRALEPMLVAKAHREQAMEDRYEARVKLHKVMAEMDLLIADTAPNGINPWVLIEQRLPKHGDRIQGRNRDKKVWREEFDIREPLGALYEWRLDMGLAEPKE